MENEDPTTILGQEDTADQEDTPEAAAARLPKLNVILKRCDAEETDQTTIPASSPGAIPVLRIVRKSPKGASEATFVVAESPKASSEERASPSPARDLQGATDTASTSPAATASVPSASPPAVRTAALPEGESDPAARRSEERTSRLRA